MEVRVEVYRKVGQTKFKKKGWEGLLTIYDSGKIAGSKDHKELFNGLIYEMDASYRCILKPGTNDMKKIMDALFEFKK